MDPNDLVFLLYHRQESSVSFFFFFFALPKSLVLLNDVWWTNSETNQSGNGAVTRKLRPFRLE